jgi:hypothetical protein
MVNAWLMYNNSFSTGLSDCIMPPADKASVNKVIADELAKAAQLLSDAHHNKLERRIGRSVADDFEMQVTTLLNGVRGLTKPAKILSHHTNRMLAMFMAGSKGDENNLVRKGKALRFLGAKCYAFCSPP